MTERHFQDEEFPEHCDHCPAPFTEGAAYWRVQLVADLDESRVGGHRSGVESSHELVLCTACRGRLMAWVCFPLKAEALEGEPPVELDEAELEAQLEQELYVLSQDPLPDPFGGPGCRLQEGAEGGKDRRGDCLTCSGCYGAHTPDCPSYGLDSPGPMRQQENRLQQKPRGCVLHPEAQDLVCFACYQLRYPPFSPEATETITTKGATPCLDPDQMHGAADQLGGSDCDEPEPWSRP